MALREYETTIIIRGDASQEQVRHARDRIKAIVEQRNGVFFHLLDLGRRSLGYPIEKQTRGFYLYADYTGDGATVAEIERFCRLDDMTVRYLTVQLATTVDVAARQAQQEADVKRLQLYFGAASGARPPEQPVVQPVASAESAVNA
ncbi:MAG: 30S ribosomal protein S6 [Deltaproteobacteria bacterium]|nr:30S ribosomal protein S6 [Deltaproteobacteria bacterium]